MSHLYLYQDLCCLQIQLFSSLVLRVNPNLYHPESLNLKLTICQLHLYCHFHLLSPMSQIINILIINFDIIKIKFSFSQISVEDLSKFGQIGYQLCH